MDRKYSGRKFGLKGFSFSIMAGGVAALIAIVVALGGGTAHGAVKDRGFWTERNGDEVVRKTGPMVGLPSFVELARDLTPTVVNISTVQTVKDRPLVPFKEFRSPFDEFFGDDFFKFFGEEGMPGGERKRESLGSGFIINKEGYILTNNHVIENATEIIVTLSEDKKEYPAEVIGRDSNLDVALIKIEADFALPSVILSGRGEVEIGQWVMAIGNPFGLGGSVTAGIVSQKGRIIGAGPYDDFIQTDASINPGNSGGPLFNLSGEVVGMNTAIVAGGQGIGFSIPIEMIKDILIQLRDKGSVTRGWIGVSIQELTPELAESFGLKEPLGALISSVAAGDPADKAGIKAGDVIVEFNGKRVTEMHDLPRIVAATPPGKRVPLKIIRDGAERALTIVTAKKKDEGAVAEGGGEVTEEESRIGITVQSLTPELAKRLRIKPGNGGVVVSSVKRNSPAWHAKIMRGDVIEEVNNIPVTSIEEYRAAVRAVKKGGVLRLLVKRGGRSIYVAIVIK